MAITVDVHEAETQLLRLLEQVERGEEVIVARSGRPIARLLPYQVNDRPRPLGRYAGKIVIDPDFDDYDDEITAMFEDGDSTGGRAG